MKNKENDHLNSIRDIISTSFLQVLNSRIDDHKEFIKKSFELIKSLDSEELSTSKSLKKAQLYKANLLELTQHLVNAGLKEYGNEFDSFETNFDNYLKSLPKKKKLVQKKERFDILLEDKLILKLLKPAKKAIYLISKWPEKISNTIRKIRGKEVVALKSWFHTINYQDLTHYCLKEKFLENLNPIIDHYYQEITASSLAVWHHDEQIDLQLSEHVGNSTEVKYESITDEQVDEILKKLDATKRSIKKKVDESFEKSCDLFDFNQLRAGTIECSNRRFSQRKSKRLHKRIEHNFKKINTRWANTLIVLTDDWQIDLELYDIIYESLYKLQEINNSIKEKLESIFDVKFEAVKSHLEEWNLKIGKSDKNSFKKLVNDDLRKVSKELNVLVDDACNYIIEQDFLETIDSLEQLTLQSLEKISKKRAVTRGVDFNSPVRSNQINYISPAELIQFETVPQFLKVTESTKVETNASLSQTEAILLQMEQILAFNIETALAKADEEKGLEEAHSIALEGIDRTIAQLDKAKAHLLKIEENTNGTLHEGLMTYCKNLIKFTNNENILELRVRIAKGKAIERGRKIKEKVIDTLKNFVPLAIRFVKSNYTKYSEKLRLKLKQLGIQGVKSNIATELADFLAGTEDVINELPVVYQRLFRARPLEDSKFFEGRSEEHSQLTKAFKSWKAGRFAATIVVGEKGSGITTLFNLFLFKLNEKIDTIRLRPEQNISKEQDLILYLNESIGGGKSLDLNQIVEYLNSGNKKIIILENLQNLYMKRIGGFAVVKVIGELISLTHKNTFWITGCTLYAFNYLDKTINFSENFSYTVRMGELSTEDIIHIIERRHKVSGYTLVFEKGADELNNKRFANMEYEEQQAYLKKNYYNELNKLTKSNISIALIYWLRSTIKGDENDIIIKSIGNIDYSFINGLSNQKTEILTLLLMHDGLNEEQVSDIMTQSTQKTRGVLHTLLEDGVVIRPDKMYFINPLLYRQTVSLLKAKNILH